MKFLSEIAPSLSVRVSGRKAGQVEGLIIEAAIANALLLRSFVVLAALSCLYEPQDGMQPMIGRGVLKPKAQYTMTDAHNALSDIRSLEFLALFAGLPGSNVGFVTQDRNLCAFWAGIGVGAPTVKGDKFSAELFPGVNLFPRLSKDMAKDLLIRLL